MSNKNLTYVEIKEKIERLKVEAQEARQRGLQEVKELVTLAMADYDMTVDELISLMTGNQAKSAAKAAKAPTTPGKPLYRNPENAKETWTGKGREPGWMKGQDREKFLIKDEAQQ